jgi:hypothetical protein
MIRTTMAVAALVLAAACGGSAPPADGPAPQGPAGRGGPGAPGAPGMMVSMGGGPPSVFALIGAREQLSLTGAQVTTLDSINRVWSVRNDTLQRRLSEIDGRRNAQTMERARPLLLRMAENNQWAGTAVQNLLSEEQRRIACTLPQVRVGERGTAARAGGPGGRRQPGGRGGMRPAGGAAADSLQGVRARRGWPWCAATVQMDSAG